MLWLQQEETRLHIFSECDLPLTTVSNFFENNLIIQHLHHRLPSLASGKIMQIMMSHCKPCFTNV